jgi:hypothetical protein
MRDLFNHNTTKQASWSESCLQFYYDLAAAPITFDFAGYLAGAELERRRRGLSAIVVIFVPGRHDGARPELPAYEAVFDRNSRSWRLRHMLVPMLAFLPTIRGYVLCGNREQAAALMTGNAAALHPSDYRVFLPRQPSPSLVHDQARLGTPIWPMLQATEHGRRLADDFLRRHAGDRRAIVITLRDSDFAPERNSHLADWIAFADTLDRDRYAAVFVCDTDTAMRRSPAELSRHVMCEAATWNLEIRMGLYEAAWLNMAVMHGPMELCWYNERARYVLFMPAGVERGASGEMLAESGVRIGSDLAFAGPFQRLVWASDQLKTIQQEFAAMRVLIEDTDHTGSAPDDR